MILQECIIILYKNNIYINLRVTWSVKNLGVYFDTSLTMEKQLNAISKSIIIIFVISVVSDVISQGMIAKPWPMPHNIKAGLWQCSPVWHARYSDGMSTKSTEFCSLTDDSKTTPYNASLELPALASSNIQVEVPDPGVCF